MLKRTAQKALLNGFRVTRLHRAMAPFSAGRGAILTLHRVRAPSARAFAPNAHLEVTPAFLGTAVDWIRGRGIDIVTLDEALLRASGRGDAGRFVVLTFDDGYRDNLEVALPVLKARNAPFTVFVASGFIDRTATPWWMVLEEVVASADRIDWTAGASEQLRTATMAEKSSVFNLLADRLESMSEDAQRAAIDDLARRTGFDAAALVDEAFMDWTELRRLAAEPLATIGAHTIGHYALAKLPEARARAEVLGGAERLAAETGRRPRHFAYPYGYPGAVGERDYRLVADLGFAAAVRTTPGVLTPAAAARPTALPRISLNGYFQRTGYVDVLLSGAPFSAMAFLGRLRGRRSPPPPLASASPST